MDDIGRDIGSWEVVHAFIKPGMLRNLHSVGSRVIPEDVLRGVRQETKEDALARVGSELGLAAAWGSYPNSAAKGPKSTEVIHLTSGHKQRREGLITMRQDITNS